MPEYRKRPIIVVNAERWWQHGDHPEVKETGPFSHQGGSICKECGKKLDEIHGLIRTLEGRHIVCPGDWIIQGIKGEFYPCKPDIFKAIMNL